MLIRPDGYSCDAKNRTNSDCHTTRCLVGGGLAYGKDGAK